MTKSGERSVSRFIATGFGVGYLPLMPGTWGSLEGVLLLLCLYSFPVASARLLHILVTVLLLLVAWLTSSRVVQTSPEKDPPWIVVDEIVGQLVCLLWVPITPSNLLFGFVLFRLLDIWKPFPARHWERLGGGIGIVVDDLVAGVYAGLLLRLLLWSLQLGGIYAG